MGHVQRVLEASGLPTVGIYVSAFGHVPVQMALPRAVIVAHPMGRPLGAPGDSQRHLDITRLALAQLPNTSRSVIEAPTTYRPWSS